MSRLDDALEDFWAARRGGPYPLAWSGRISQDEAYGINLALIDRHAAEGEAHVGWKVGLTARAIREQFDLPEPVFACLYEPARWPSGGRWPLAGLQGPGIENELLLTLGETLRGPGVTEADARRAVATVAPAMELIETRGPNTLDGLNAGLADNGQQRAFVVGAETRYDPAIHDLAGATVQVFIDGVRVDEAPGSAVMDSGPLASVAWLANKLAEFDRAVEAGQVVMTGSFTRQFAVDRPMTIEARFAPFGSAIATFT